MILNIFYKEKRKAVDLFLQLFGIIICYFCAISLSQADQEIRPRYSWSLGSYYSQGDYQRNNSTIISMIPIGIKRQRGLSWIKLNSALISIKGPGTINPEINDIDNPTQNAQLDNTQVNKTTGLGDTFLSAGKLFWHSSYWLELSSQFKFATGDNNQGLGTGKNDLKVSGKFFYPIEKWTPYLEIGYQWRQSPANVELLNRPSLGLGSAMKLNPHHTWIIQFDWHSKSISNAPSRQEIFIAEAWKINRNNTFSLYTHTGFTTASPDFGLGLQVLMRR